MAALGCLQNSERAENEGPGVTPVEMGGALTLGWKDRATWQLVTTT